MKRNRSVVEQDSAPLPRRVAGAAVMQPTVTEALTRALFVEWARVGYGALSLEAVAKRAGVGKAALYRRWPSKLAMVTDRLEQADMDWAQAPDTGSLLGDVRALLRSLRRVLRHPIVRRIVPDLHAEMLRSPALAHAIRTRIQVVRRERSALILRQAIQRGELPAHLDLELANDMIGSMIYWRVIVTGGRTDSQYLERLARFIVAALQACGNEEAAFTPETFM